MLSYRISLSFCYSKILFLLMCLQNCAQPLSGPPSEGLENSSSFLQFLLYLFLFFACFQASEGCSTKSNFYVSLLGINGEKEKKINRRWWFFILFHNSDPYWNDFLLSLQWFDCIQTENDREAMRSGKRERQLPETL